MEVEASNHLNCATDLYAINPTMVTVVEVTQNEKVENLDVSIKDTVDKCPPNSEVKSEKENLKPPNDPPTISPSAKNNVGKYRLLRTIGKGNFAKVKLAIHMATGVEVAIKIINKTVMDQTLLKRLKREITIMKVTNHPNIVKLLEIIENEDVLCLVMEYASGGEIFDYLVAHGKMREKEAQNKFRQLLSAIQYCHAKKIVHRDLKAENILLDQNLNVKVADFGLANTFEYDQRLTTFCGSPPYAAPELFLGIPYYGPGVDVWSLGVILFTLVLGHLPFDARDLRELRSKILGLHYTIPKGAISPECEALLRKMLVLDPKDRSSLKNLMQDKWINHGYPPNEFLRPYKESPKTYLDDARVKAMEVIGFTRADLESSVINPEFDHVYATYHLLPGTPSEFVSLCDDLTQHATETQHSVGLPNSLVPIKSGAGTKKSSGTTAIGRFTVAPSNKTSEHPNTVSASRSSSRVGRGSPDSTISGASSKNAGYVSETSPREHHSLTSNLPVALKRALLQVGRTFGAGSSGTGATNSVEMNARVAPHSGRANNRPSKTNEGRNMITAAPIPMGNLKKPGLSAPHHSKRTPASLYPGRTDSGESCSTTVSASSQRSPGTTSAQSGPTQHLGLLTPQRSLSKVESAALAAQTSPETQSPRPSVKAKPDVTQSKPHTNSSKTEDTRLGVTFANQDTVKQTFNDPPVPVRPTSSSSTSSDSYGERELRETAALLVRKVWRTVDPSAPNDSQRISSMEQKPRTGFVAPKEPKDTKDTFRIEKPELSRSLTNVTDPSEPLAGADWSVQETQSVSSKEPAVLPQIKVSHTVQGSEALAFREQALRLQSSNETHRPALTSYTVDGNHQVSWGRGVLKALGGLFVQGKSPDPRSDSSSSQAVTKPREVRFPWSVHTTSTKSADEVMRAIIEALECTPGCRYTHDPQLPFLLQCSWANDRDALRTIHTEVDTSESENLPNRPISTNSDGLLRGDPVHWEMEVCQLPRMHLRGVRLRRIRGSALQFRPIADLVMKSLHL